MDGILDGGPKLVETLGLRIDRVVERFRLESALRGLGNAEDDLDVGHTSSVPPAGGFHALRMPSYEDARNWQ
jgi:hypothetical protein